MEPKEISVAGSGRLGYSLAPKRWGERYDPRSSDLDFFAVSKRLFESLRGDFERWSMEFANGKVRPSTSERKYWEANQIETPKNIGRGFLDSKRVPNRSGYGHFLRLNDRLAKLKMKLGEVEGGPRPPGRSTLRCYRDWGSFEQQLALNLERAVAQAGVAGRRKVVVR